MKNKELSVTNQSINKLSKFRDSILTNKSKDKEDTKSKEKLNTALDKLVACQLMMYL